MKLKFTLIWMMKMKNRVNLEKEKNINVLYI